MMNRKQSHAKPDVDLSNGFVADGYERAIAGIESELRREIEKKYADDWNASGLINRWVLSRKIEREIRALVAKRSKQISPEAHF